jgi:signal peptidase I
VIGLPGDLVKIMDCQVYIGGEGKKYVLYEGYLDEGMCTEGAVAIKDGRSLRIPANEYMLLGDNRKESIDSRYLGFINKNKILGRVVFRFWPVSGIGFIN